MKRVFAIYIAFAILVYASVAETQREIYKNILDVIFANKKVIHIWVDDTKMFNILKKIKNVKIVTDYNKADILIISRSYDFKNSDKMIFTNGYGIFKLYRDIEIGGFYWQKGRPNLIFIRKNLKRYGISLDSKLSDFIEDE